ncbi:proteasome assembly chaperone 4-like [Hydractinia symbiolongicarpus]|uniref:proteasome assembly chaperone 4-like n=1 Tax=Hydractinia symbiolongicarpus TaxID=13093 RepID=UPI0025502EEA|nr:proteasome assembly chaperone 4-like [Hydractinia symbiolongicarpus]
MVGVKFVRGLQSTVKCSMDEINFFFKLQEKVIFIRTLSCSNSVFVWIGDSNLTFSNLSVAACTKFSKVPSAVTLLGNSKPDSIAQKLSKRLKKQVLLSWNFHSEPLSESLDEDTIFREIVKKFKE